MDTLDSIKVFCSIVEQGSFTKAAQYLGISTAMASKHLKNLENYAQAKLLNRSSRMLSLTEAGHNFYKQSYHALDVIENARMEAQQQTISPSGILKLSMPAWGANLFCAKMFAQFQKKYPQVHISLYLENRFVDIITEGFDLALRVSQQLNPNVIAKKIIEIPFYRVASQDYLDKHGIPKSDLDLSMHQAIAPNHTKLNIDIPAVIDTNNTVMEYFLAQAGMGLAFVPEWLLKENNYHHMKIILDDPEYATVLPLYAVYPDRKFLSAKVRAFIDFITEYLQE